MENSTRRITSLDGVNAARTFFEHHGCVFQEVAQQNDFGKDAYVDLNRARTITFFCAALQIKSGISYRMPNGDYFIPIANHAENWRHSTVPVFGLVYDPDDQLIRWVDLTGYLRNNPRQDSGNIPVCRNTVLTEASLQEDFAAAISEYVGRFGTIALNLLTKPSLQVDALYDAWALGRFDAKYLLILRRLIMDLQPEALRRTIFLLSHAGSHPNIFFGPHNWIPPKVENELLPSFRWSPEEISKMLSVVDYSDWGYHTLGECLDVLFYEDPNIVSKLHIAIKLLLKDTDLIYAVRAATLALSHSKDKRKEVSALKAKYPQLMNHGWFQDISSAVEESGDYSIYI